MPDTIGTGPGINGSFRGVPLTSQQVQDLIDNGFSSTYDVTNLVNDGTFDEATSTTWSGNAYNPVDGVNEVVVTSAGNAGDINLSGTVNLKEGEIYTLSFDVSGEPGRTIVAGIGQSDTPGYSHTKIITLNDTSQTIVMHLTAKDEVSGADFGDAASRVIFDMGADTGAVSIDNVSLFVGHNGRENPVGSDYDREHNVYGSSDSGLMFYPPIMPTGLSKEGGAFLSSYARQGSSADAYFALNGTSLGNEFWETGSLEGTGISISLTVQTPDGNEISFEDGATNKINTNGYGMLLEQTGSGDAPITAAIMLPFYNYSMTTLAPASDDDFIYSVTISSSNGEYLDGEYKITGLSVTKDNAETVVATPEGGVPVFIIDDSDVQFWASQSSDVIYERDDRAFEGTDDFDELTLDGSLEDYEVSIIGDRIARLTHIASGSEITVSNTEEVWIKEYSSGEYQRDHINLINLPLISSALSSAELMELVPDFQDVTQADLSLPFIYWDKPNGDEYLIADMPIAKTTDLTLYTADWQGKKIIIGDNQTSTVVKLNLAENPEVSGSNFLANIELYNQWASGELNETEINQFVDDPENAFDLAENTGSSASTGPVKNVNDSPLGFLVTITGDAAEESTLAATASVSSDDDGPQL